MKLPKTRIKITTQGEDKRYYPQYRNCLGFWTNIMKHDYPWQVVMEDAEHEVDTFLSREENKIKAKQKKKLPKITECVKYP